MYMFYPKALWFSVYQLVDFRVSKIGGCFFETTVCSLQLGAL